MRPAFRFTMPLALKEVLLDDWDFVELRSMVPRFPPDLTVVDILHRFLKTIENDVYV